MKSRVEKRIKDNFLRSILSGGSARRQAILGELLTQTEKIMLAKRLAMIVMLENDFSYYRISKTLKVSTSTLKRLHRHILAGSYRQILTSLTGNRADAIIRFLEKILEFRMPPIAGPGRWKFLDERRK